MDIHAGHTVRGVYPRVCGGTGDDGGFAAFRVGSIPACAGEPRTERWSWRNGRSIPACAGEPPRVALAPQRFWVYPRVCGGTVSTCR